MCGRSFSGKSTLALALADRLGAQRVSLDAINEERGLRGGDGIPVSEWMRTNDEASAHVEEALSAGRAVIVDDTSSPRFLRGRWHELASRAHAEMALVFVDATEELIRARLAANRSDLARHDVIDDVMDAHLGAFEAPETDEHAIPVDAGTPIDASVAQVLAALAERYPARE
jgi:predicted kinase